jgi:hypothetical protein
MHEIRRETVELGKGEKRALLGKGDGIKLEEVVLAAPPAHHPERVVYVAALLALVSVNLHR